MSTINGRQTDYMRAEDIKHPGRLTSEQVASIPSSLAFEWIKIGKWKMKDFNRWLNSQKEFK